MLPMLFFAKQWFLGSYFLAYGVLLFFITVASFLALNFTGCTPITNLSGVKKEMRLAVPAYVAACAAATVFIVLFKLWEWGSL